MTSETLTATDFESFGYSSENVRPADRIPLYRDILDRLLIRMDLQPVGEQFYRKARALRLPSLSIYCVDGDASRLGWGGLKVEEG